MGCTGSINTYEYEYFTAYRSIRKILKDIYRLNRRIENVYLVNVGSINNFITEFKKYNFLKKLKFCQESEIENIENLVLRKLKDYKIEENIDIIDIKADNYEEIKGKKFIFVDYDFLKKWNKYTEENQKKKQTLINIHKSDNTEDIKMQMDIEIINENEDEKKIYQIIEDENDDGIYKFQDCINKSLDINNASNAKIVNEDVDSEIDNSFRVPIPKDKNNKQDSNNENEEDKNSNNINDDGNQNNLIKINNDENAKSNNITSNNNDENPKEIDNNKNNNKKINLKDGENSNIEIIEQNCNVETQKDKNIKENETAKATKAKFDEIIYDIIWSIQNSSTSKDIIMKSIQDKIKDLNINKELEKKDRLDIIGNIKTSVKYYFLNNSNNNKNNDNSIDINKPQDGEGCDIGNHIEPNDLYLNEENSNEGNRFGFNDNQEVINNPFIFKQVKIFISEPCDKCVNINNKISEAECVKIIPRENYFDFETCFNMKYIEDCENKCEFSLKFESTPDILILVFDEPKTNKNFIKFKDIDESIDLKKHLYKINNKDSSEYKYKLIKALYYFNDIEDNKLYVNIPEEEKNNYIPYAIFYKKNK